MQNTSVSWLALSNALATCLCCRTLIVISNRQLSINDFKAGYARNFLVPQGKAVPATKKNVEFFEARRAELEAKLADVLAAANARAEAINALGTVTIASKSGDEGKLFGSIGTRDIADAVTAAGVDVAKSEVRLPNGVLRTTGEHEVDFQVHSEVFAKLIVNVVAE